MLSHVQLFETLWTVAHWAPLSMEFSRQEYCSGLPFPTPKDLANPEIEPAPLASPSLAVGFFSTVSPGKQVDMKSFIVFIFFFFSVHMILWGNIKIFGLPLWLSW